MINYFLVGGDVPIDNDTFLMTEFLDLKIKSGESFISTHIDKMYMHMSYIYEYIYLYCVSQQK
jgi:hypothetical protein